VSGATGAFRVFGAHGAATVAGATLLGNPAFGEPLVGTVLWEVSTQDGDALVEPGETATVSLALEMMPDVVAQDEDGNQGFSAMIFDTLGGAGAANGQIIGWEPNQDLTFLTGDLTTTDGVNLFFTNLGQLALAGGPFAKDNPIDLLSFEWEPAVTGSYTVEYFTSTDILQFWTGTFADSTSTTAGTLDAPITFEVVPGPGTALGPAMLGVMTFLRRSRAP